MKSFKAYVEKQICEVESWLALPPEDTDWQQVAEDCRSLLAEVEQAATLAGVPEAVTACQVRTTTVSVSKARQILSECLAACQTDHELIEPILLTVKQAAARYNMGERTLYRLLEQGELPNCGHGTSKRIKPSDLVRYLEGPAQTHAAPGSLFD